MRQVMRVHKKDGVTIVELLVVIAIAGILASIAIPSYRNMVVSSRISDMVSTLHSTMLFARSEALKRGRPIVLCPSANADETGAKCSAGDGEVGWGTGWLLFADKNSDNKFDADETLIRVQGTLIKNASDGSIKPNNASSFVTFNSTGQVLTPVDFVIKGPSDMTGMDKAICIGVGGRAKAGKAPDCS